MGHNGAPPAGPRWMHLTEYRLDELSQVSGVSVRNIRAYRERGLLDPPRRVGRTSVYSDQHLSQLRAISHLLRRGFTSVQIADFFAALRRGADLAEALGVDRSMVVPADRGEPARPVRIDAGSAEAAELVESGLADLTADGVVFRDPTIAGLIARAPDPLVYVRALLRLQAAIEEPADRLVTAFVEALMASVAAVVGAAGRTSAAAETVERLVRDHRELWGWVVSERLDKSLQRHLSGPAAQYAGGVALGGAWRSRTPDAG